MSFRATLSLLPALFLLPSASLAESVDFDEMPPMNDSALALSDEYADLGLHFMMSGSTWGGRAAGDPGGWGLEGTSGSGFLGVEGPIFNVVMRFDSPVADLSFDVAAAEEGAPMLMVFGYRENSFVEMVSTNLSDTPDDWSTIAMSEDVDIVVCLQVGDVPYGLDRMRWTGPYAAPEEMEVAIDIRPGSERNPIQVGSRGVVPVVLWGSPELDLSEVDPDSISFGPGAVVPAHEAGPHTGDRDGDGFVDWMMHFRVDEAGIGSNDTEVCLSGTTWEGMAFFGCDRVEPVGKSKARKR